MKNETKICQNCKKDFIIEPEDFNFYEKIKVPPPTFCPDCRVQRRLTWRNERTLYKRSCQVCGKSIFAVYSPQSSVVVYCLECWLQDSWSPQDFAIDYDWNKPFFSQWAKLYSCVPQRNLQNTNLADSSYGGNMILDSNRLYLSYSIIKSEDIYFSKDVDQSKQIFDSLDIVSSNTIYEGVLSYNNYNCNFVVNSRDCIDSSYLYDCVNCQNCFLCAGLRNKKYCIRNKQISKEEYSKEINKLNLGSYKFRVTLLEEFRKLKFQVPHKFASISKCTGSTGDDLFNSKNARFSFSGHELENVKHNFRTLFLKDSYDVSYGSYAQLIYESQGAGIWNSSNIKFNIHGVSNGHNYNNQYVAFCGSSSNCFACVGLRNKSYCILNKQYTKEEYKELIPKIIQQMNDMPYVDRKGRVYKYGEFFPPELSPFYYNETIAQEYFPLAKEEALKQGYKWKEKEERNYNIDIHSKDIPNDIKDVNDEIIGKVIECEHEGTCNEQCTEAFKIIPDELTFYKRMNLPIPHFCPNCRHYQRLKQRNPLKLWHRYCMKEGCTNEFETSYAPDRPEVIYCEKCYQQEVY